MREDVEEARRRWDAAGQRSDLLIRAGLPLSEAEHAAAALADELPASTRAFIERSGRSARLRQQLTAAAALVFLALAVAAGFLGFVAQTQKLKAQQAAEEAEQQRAQAESARGQAEAQRQQAESARKVADQQRQQAETARQLADLQRQQAEMRLAAADELLDSNGKIEELRQCLASTARIAVLPPPPASREFFVGRWHVDQGGGSSDVDWRDNGTCETRNIFADGTHPLDLKADVCTWQFEKVADDRFVVAFQSTKLGDNYPRRLSFKIVSPVRIRNTELNYDAFRVVCPAQELEGHQKELENRQRRAAADLGNLTNQRDLATSHIGMGDVLAAQGRHQAALEHYVRGSEIRRNLAVADPANRAWQHDLAFSYDRIGRAHQILGESAEALAAYQQSVLIRQRLADANRANAQLQSELEIGRAHV